MTGINTVLLINKASLKVKSVPDSRWLGDVKSEVRVSKGFSCLFGIKKIGDDMVVVMVDEVRHVVTYRCHEIFEIVS